jgi:hypothetical protein
MLLVIAPQKVGGTNRKKWVARMALYELFYCATSLAAEREIF